MQHDDARGAPSAISKSLWAYRTARTMILSGALPPGFPIDQQALATQLGISTTPLREALRRLAPRQELPEDVKRHHRDVDRLDHPGFHRLAEGAPAEGLRFARDQVAPVRLEAGFREVPFLLGLRGEGDLLQLPVPP